MKIPEELMPDIIPGCPLSTRFAVEMYTGDTSKIPCFESNDPEYIQKLYLSWIEHRSEIDAQHCDLSDYEQAIALGLHAIGWIMLSNHIQQDVSIYDIYVAMCDFETKQREFKNIHEFGFIGEEA